MTWRHVRALTPNGVRQPAWRCDVTGCGSVTFSTAFALGDKPPPPCKHPRLRQTAIASPIARKETG